MDPKLEARLKPGTDYHPLQVIPFFRRCAPRCCNLQPAVHGSPLRHRDRRHRAVLARHGASHHLEDALRVATFSLLIGYTQHYLYKLTITLARRRQRLAPVLMHPWRWASRCRLPRSTIGYVLAVSAADRHALAQRQ